MVPISIGFKTHPGKRRETNQDSYAILRPADLGGRQDALLVVADGMGGVKGGEIASRIVAETVSDAIRHNSNTEVGGAALLTEAIQIANEQVLARNNAESRSEPQRMGTTCVTAILEGNTLVVGNVGDSRAYLLHQGQLFQVTQDHSQVWRQVQSGQMSREEARSSKYRNVVTRMVGLSEEVEPDIFPIALVDGDVLLLCSDGLSSEVPDSHIARILASASTPQEASEKLVVAALEAGGSDNITVVVLCFGKMVAQTLREPSLPLQPEEENTTDPDGKWREELRAASQREREEVVLPLRVSSPPQRSNTPLLVVLLLLIVGLGAGLAWTWLAHIPKLRAKAPEPALPPPPVKQEPRTARPLFYGAVVPMSASKVQGSFLQLDSDGKPIVAEEEGQIVKVNGKGELEPMPGRPTLPASPQKPTPQTAWVLYDQSGNRYQTHTPSQSIFKFDSAGTRIRYDIGKGKVITPTALAVAPSGDILYISRQHLYRIPAFETEPVKKATTPKPESSTATPRNP